MKRKNILAAISLAMALSFASSSVLAKGANYEVTITNITKNVIFTPILVASHRKGFKLFKPGQAADSVIDGGVDELEQLAEGGDIGPMTTLLQANSKVIDVANSGGPLMPGASVTVVVSAKKGAKFISLVSMMLPTNDGFIALNGVRAPHRKAPIMYRSPGYDAGTEFNDELCVNIPGGGVCAGSGFVVGGEEGYVHIHSGIHGIADLAPETYDWHNPAATITIQRVSQE